MEEHRLTRDIALQEHNSTSATPATGGSVTLRQRRRRRSAVGPIKTISILGLVGAFVAAIALPAFAGTAAPAVAPVAAVEAGPEEQPQELVVASTVADKELDRNSLSATSATEIAEEKAAAEAEAQRQAYLDALASQSSSYGSPALASVSMASLPAGSGAVVWPLPSGSWYIDGADSHFGTRGYGHAGFDLTAPHGTSIYSIAEGVVTAVGYSGGWGNRVVVEHIINGTRYQSLYAHMPYGCFGVGVGDYVSAGQYIGCVGSTGNSYGPHLHLELRQNGSLIDPYWFLVNNAG